MNPTLSPARIASVIGAAESGAGDWFRLSGLNASEAGYAIAAVSVASWGPHVRAIPASQQAIAKAFYNNPRLTRRAIEIITTALAMQRALV